MKIDFLPEKPSKPITYTWYEAYEVGGIFRSDCNNHARLIFIPHVTVLYMDTLTKTLSKPIDNWKKEKFIKCKDKISIS